MPWLVWLAQWIEHWPPNRKFTGSLPSQDTCLGCGPGSQFGVCDRQPTDVSLIHECFSPSPFLSLPLSLKINLKKIKPDLCGPVGWASSYKAKGHGFKPWSGDMPGMQIQSPVRVHTRGNESMCLSHIDVSLPLSLLSPFSKNKEIKSF